MDLGEFLEVTGWSKSKLADYLGLSRQAVGKWESIPSDWEAKVAEPFRAAELKREVDKKLGDLPQKPLVQMSELEVLHWIRNRSKFSDWDICQILECRVWEWESAIQHLVDKYPFSDPFWRQVHR